MTLIAPGQGAVGPSLNTMHQAPMPPWRTDEEAEDYMLDPRSFLLDRCALWVRNCTVFHNWLVTSTYYLPHKIGTGKTTLFLPDSVHDGIPKLETVSEVA